MVLLLLNWRCDDGRSGWMVDGLGGWWPKRSIFQFRSASFSSSSSSSSSIWLFFTLLFRSHTADCALHEIHLLTSLLVGVLRCSFTAASCFSLRRSALKWVRLPLLFLLFVVVVRSTTHWNAMHSLYSLLTVGWVFSAYSKITLYFFLLLLPCLYAFPFWCAPCIIIVCKWTGTGREENRIIKAHQQTTYSKLYGIKWLIAQRKALGLRRTL